MQRLYLITGLVIVIGLIVAFVTRASGEEKTFAEYPGFSDYVARYPPRAVPATVAEQQLLQRHRPRFFLPGDHAGLISFYDDYIAQGTLRGPDGEVISSRVTPSLLNAYKDKLRVCFEHEPDLRQPQTPVVFGRVDYSDELLGDKVPQRFTILTYHTVFRTSGIVAGVAWWQALPLSVAGNLTDWHQLDHYTAAFLVLDALQQPVALMLQQHNYVRTYLYREALSLPEDGRPLVDVATRSNELYPHETGRVRRRAVSFLDPKSFRYMIGAAAKPIMTADDITEPEIEAAYELRYLAPNDAFYTFKGMLGKRRSLSARSGPPGADYNTLPDLKPMHLQLVAGYWRTGHAGDIGRLEAALATPNYFRSFVESQRPIFQANLRCAMQRDAEC